MHEWLLFRLALLVLMLGGLLLVALLSVLLAKRRERRALPRTHAEAAAPRQIAVLS